MVRRIRCSSCQAGLKIPDDASGHVRCPKCHQQIALEEEASTFAETANRPARKRRRGHSVDKEPFDWQGWLKPAFAATGLIVLIVVGVWVVPNIGGWTSGSDKWYPFQDPDGVYGVTFPRRPKPMEEAYRFIPRPQRPDFPDTFSGYTTLMPYRSAEFAVMKAECPFPVSTQTFEIMLQAMALSFNGWSESKREIIRFQGRDAMDVTMTTFEKQAQVRFIASGRLLFVLVGETKPQESEVELAYRFIDSFRLLNAPR